MVTSRRTALDSSCSYCAHSSGGRIGGVVVVGTTSNTSTVGELEESLVTAAAGYFSRQVG